jgi:hypothetical protein
MFKGVDAGLDRDRPTVGLLGMDRDAPTGRVDVRHHRA